jgi:molybdate transport system substrate-binding protein
MPIVLALLLAAGVVASAQTGTPPGDSIQVVRVAAASDLQFALEDIIARLKEQRPDLRIEVVYGSSGTIHAQLRQRAPYDVFLSADIGYPRDLVSRGVGSEADLFTYATGRLVVWTPAASKLAVEREGLRALENAGRIAIANPRHAPYGRAAEAAIRRVGLWERVSDRLVLGENVAQTAQFVQSGAADVGVIAKSLAVASGLRNGRYWEVPEQMHPPLIQGGVILPWARSRTGATQFRDFLVSADGRRILAAYGFDAPPK